MAKKEKISVASVTITWVPEDIKTLRPKWSLNKCERALEEIAKVLQDRSIEEGWNIIDSILEKK